MKAIILIFFVSAINLLATATVHMIKVSNFQFSPESVNALVGDTVLWVYKIGFHTTTSTTITVGALPWDSPIEVNTTRFQYVVSLPGVYNYTSIPHAEEMKGIVKIFSTAPAGISSFEITENEDGNPKLFWNITDAAQFKSMRV